jgi:hypothetical protein
MDRHSLYFGGTEIHRIDSNQNFSGLGIFPDLVYTFS